ncbi:sensor domain-containing protein [Pseudonocardia sp. KRD-291]|nr:sensor domain-containing protein [Pseudonocardia sp. KRD291]
MRQGRAAAELACAVVVGTVAFGTLVCFGLGLILIPVFGIGVPVVIGALGALRRIAGVVRGRAGTALGAELTAPYTSTPSWAWRDLRSCLRDPQTWRDAVWAVANTLLTFATVLVGYILAQIGLHGIGPATFLVPQILLVLAVAIAWWTIPWALHLFVQLARLLLAPPPDPGLRRRVAQLTESRAATVDAQAAELRRIERDLHDGAQARLAAVSITLGLAAQVLRTDPERAFTLLAEARADAGTAQSELRDLVRGIHPPVLADRGLAGGLEAAALLCPVPVRVEIALPHRPQAPVESALYFATTEALTNIGRHAGATRAWLHAGHSDGTLCVLVGDDGHGGADPAAGTGLRGIARRLAAFDGTCRVTSPPGGPTEIRMELPCPLSEPSSPRTTSSSGTG